MTIRDKILIIEDEPTIANFMRAILEARDYEVMIVQSGAMASTLIASHCPDLIILDLGLPDMDGMQILTAVRQWSKVPVVVVDHHGNEDADVYGTITHNRARGTHLLEPMKAIVKKLLDEGKDVDEIGKQLGMKPEEIFRLSGFTRDEFLDMMTQDHPTFSKAKVIRSV